MTGKKENRRKQKHIYMRKTGKRKKEKRYKKRKKDVTLLEED